MLWGGGANVAKDSLLIFDPFEDSELLEFNVARAAGRLLGVSHESCCVIVLADDGWWQLLRS